MKQKVAIVRGKFLNKYEMQFFEPLVDSFDITAFGSLSPFHDRFAFPVQKLWCPLDVPDFPYKMSILNRVFVDAHYLSGLESSLAGFDLVHTAETYFRYTQQCLDAKKKGLVKKVIATVLENIPFNNEGITGRSAFKKRAREELDHIIALTERTKTALLLEGADEKKITVISHFVDTTRFMPKKSPAVAKALAGKHELTILFCGRLEKYKGVYEILYAIKLLLMDPELKKNKFSLMFVGDGGEKNGMIALEKKLGIENYIVHKTVSYDEMPKIYLDADIYLAPSLATETWQEQYNTTLLEAQASGLAIITTRSGGIPENVGDAAILIQPADVLSLQEAMKQLILDPKLRNTYADMARKRAVTVHDKTIGAKKIAAIYTQVLGNG